MSVARHTIAARAFNQDVSSAKRAADDGPVVITDRGRPAYVLMTHAEYMRLTSGHRSLIDLLADNSPEADFDFDPPRDRTPLGPIEFD